MKKLLFVLMFLTANVKASPYFYMPFVTKDAKLYTSAGAITTPRFGSSYLFTNMAVIYHPLTSSSIVPQELQAYFPPESWSINLGGGCGGGVCIGGPGISVNLLDSARAYTANLLSLSNSESLNDLGARIRPGNGPVNLAVGRQWAVKMVQDGTALPFNQMRLDPFWFFGVSFGF